MSNQTAKHLDLSAEITEQPIGREVTIEHLDTKLDLTYNWGYEKARQDLRDLYKKAQRSQWQPDVTLPWQLAVDLEHPHYPEELFPLYGSDIYKKMSEQMKTRLGVEMFSWILSQFLHGEQGALLAASQLVTTVPDMDSKYYASTQVFDEGRHVEVYDRYLHEKIGFSYPISPYLKKLLDLILTDSRWDMKLLGMQIMVEGLALAAFGMIRQQTSEQLLKKLTHYVMLDEARHVAYGVLSLRNYYDDMKEADRMEREDFIYEAAVLMRDRFLYQQVWEKMGMPVEECKQIALQSVPQQMFRQMLFSKIVPAVKKMGLLGERQRKRFEALGILQFESWADPFEDLDRENATADALVA
ncbi:MAG: ferritin-like domain-containing protein [Myxococcales bacterium]|nr:ferritin-like domain-containing protein [Myxococcales bacterium]